MWLSLLLLLLLFAITIYQAKQGLFSAFLMTALTLCCATAALGTYEWVAIHWLAPYWKPDYAHPIALGATFGLPLLILRVVFDRLIRRACLLPGWMDRVGGSVCGLVTGLIMVGVVAIGLKMIPFGTSIIGYAPVVVSPQPKERTQSTKVPKAGGEERNLLLGVDRFAAAVTSVLSGGIFSGRQSFYQYNPDLVQAVGWVGAAHPMISRYAPPKSISVTHTEPIEFVYRFTPGEEGQSPTYEPTETRNGKFHVVKIELRSSARDERKSFTFTLRQFRLVGHPKGSDTYEQYYP
ncbi:MAG: CvpA family protein, partial [Phycisphaerae bacterium]